jgi:hypothetical protein
MNGCADTSLCYNVTNLSISDLAMSNQLAAYPNPGNGVFHLSEIAELRTASIQIQVYNLLGETVLQQNVSGLNEVVVDLTNQPVGTYLLELRTDTELFYSKLIRQ